AGFVSIVSPRNDSAINLILTSASDTDVLQTKVLRTAQLQRRCCKNRNRIFLPLKIRVLITDTRDATGLVAHRNRCVGISAVWSSVRALGCSVARSTRG